MIGDEEAALWRQAAESPDALDVYLDWLLTHDPIRGALLRARMSGSKLTEGETSQEQSAWLQALGLDGVSCSVGCKPLPQRLSIDAQQIAALDPVLERIPFLHIHLEFTPGEVAAAFASPTMAKIRALSFSAWVYEEENYQSDPYWYFGDDVVRELCASPHVTQLEVLVLSGDPGYESAKYIAAVPFVGLRDLEFSNAIVSGDGIIAIARSPIIKTLRRLALHGGLVCDADALALANAPQLEELSIRGHRIGPTAEAALRAMPSLKRIELSNKE